MFDGYTFVNLLKIYYCNVEIVIIIKHTKELSGEREPCVGCEEEEHGTESEIVEE